MPEYKFATALVLAVLALAGCDKTPSDESIISYHNNMLTERDKNHIVWNSFRPIAGDRRSEGHVAVKVMAKSLVENGEKVRYAVLEREIIVSTPYRAMVANALDSVYDYPTEMSAAEKIPFNPPESAVNLGMALEQIKTKGVNSGRKAERVILKYATRTNEDKELAEKLLMKCGDYCKNFTTAHRGTFANYLANIAIREQLLNSSYILATPTPEPYIMTEGVRYLTHHIDVPLKEFK